MSAALNLTLGSTIFDKSARSSRVTLDSNNSFSICFFLKSKESKLTNVLNFS